MKELLIDWLKSLPYGYYLENPYYLAGFIILATIILAWLLLFVFARYLLKFASRTKTKVDDIIFERTKTPLFLLILVYGFKLAVLTLGLNGLIAKIINSLMALVFILVLIRALDIVIDTWGMTFAKRTKTDVDNALLPLFHKVARVVFVIIAILWVLHIWNIDITPYLAGAGIAGLVLGFALQDTLKNVLGGIMLILDQTFQVGDKIKLESGEVGTIHDIGLRSTKLVTFDNEIIYVPNGNLANSRVQNYTRPTPKVRNNIDFGVEYGTDPEKVKKVVLAALSRMQDVMNEPVPEVDFLEMGDFSLKFRAKFWVARWEQAYQKKLEATGIIYKALQKARIGIPFPTQTIYLKKERNS